MTRRLRGLAMASVLLVTACGGSASPSPSGGSSAPGDSGSTASQPPASQAAATVTLTLRYCWGGEGEVMHPLCVGVALPTK